MHQLRKLSALSIARRNTAVSVWNACFRFVKVWSLVTGAAWWWQWQRQQTVADLRQDPPPPSWGYFSHLWSWSLNFFLFESSWKKWKMTPLLCACAVVITLETQKCWKRAPRSVEFNFFINCDRHKRFSQNERRGVDLQIFASDFLIFA